MTSELTLLELQLRQTLSFTPINEVTYIQVSEFNRKGDKTASEGGSTLRQSEMCATAYSTRLYFHSPSSSHLMSVL
jgi:hypothetical protein